jgi:hypothetical protein
MKVFIIVCALAIISNGITIIDDCSECKKMFDDYKFTAKVVCPNRGLEQQLEMFKVSTN